MKMLSHVAAGLSVGMVCYAIYFIVLLSSWPVQKEVALMFAETPAEERANILAAFEGFHVEMCLGLLGLVFPVGFAAAGFLQASRNPIRELERPATQIGIYIWGLLAVLIAQAGFKTLLPTYRYLPEFLRHHVQKQSP